MTFLDKLKDFFGLGTLPGNSSDTSDKTDTSDFFDEPKPVSRAVSDLPPTPRLRDQLYRFVVESLATYATERDTLPTGLKLWICCDDPAREDGFNVALYAGKPEQFRQELSRHLADHYVKLAPNWSFSWQIVPDSLPPQCTYRQQHLGLEVLRPDTEKPRRAHVRVLVGQTAQASYVLDPVAQTEFRVGRGEVVQTATGRIRSNDIVFVDATEPGFDADRGEPNLSVSRQHATIHYDTAHRRYRLVADAGGLPASGNKTKIIHANDTVDRADLPGVGYVLASGDQIELGGEAKLLFEMDS